MKSVGPRRSTIPVELEPSRCGAGWQGAWSSTISPPGRWLAAPGNWLLMAATMDAAVGVAGSAAFVGTYLAVWLDVAIAVEPLTAQLLKHLVLGSPDQVRRCSA
jgi:hypothetical protein